MDASTRILLVDMPRMLREIVQRTLEAEPDMAIVGFLADTTDIRASIERSPVDVIIAGASSGELVDRCRALLGVSPSMKVLAVSDDARTATFYELEPATHRLGELSSVELAAAIRTARSRRLSWVDG